MLTLVRVVSTTGMDCPTIFAVQGLAIDGSVSALHRDYLIIQTRRYSLVYWVIASHSAALPSRGSSAYLSTG